MKLCECGCEKPAPIAQRTNRKFGHVKGEPVRFIKGHNGAKAPVKYVEKDCGYKTPCWVWQRNKDPDGYGRLTVKGKGQKAANWMWEQANNRRVPPGWHLDHLCRNPPCVNPDHLEPVTPRENTLRGESPAARHAEKTHCPKGHAYDEKNTRYEKKNGARKCRACGRERWRRKYGRKGEVA